MSFKDEINEQMAERMLLDPNHPLEKCEWCGELSRFCVDTPSQTMYTWDEANEEDPNRSKLLCCECAIEYTDRIESQWADYYRGLL